jgi:hypothetical protein
LAAVVYQRGFDIDRLMLGVSDELRLRGLVLGGLLQSSFGGPGACAQSVLVADLRSDNVFDIWGRRRKDAGGCRRDEIALLDADPVLRTAINDRVDLILVNRFGRAESLGRGLINIFVAALEAGIPVLTVVRPPYDDAARRAFHGGLGCELLPQPGAIVSWVCGSTYAECPIPAR